MKEAFFQTQYFNLILGSILASVEHFKATTIQKYKKNFKESHPRCACKTYIC